MDTSTQQAAPALHLPVMSEPVLRKQAPGGSTPSGGVEAAGWLDTIGAIARGIGTVGNTVGGWLS